MAGAERRPETLVAIVRLALCVALLAGCADASFGVGPLFVGAGASHKGTVLYSDPGVSVERPDKGVIRDPSGMQLLPGDIVDTAGGQAVIEYDDGSTVTLNRQTRVQLGSIKLLVGELFARIKSIAKQGGGQVVTKELSASVEGTEFDVRRSDGYPATAPGNVAVFVREGRVLCTPESGARWPPILLTENLSLTVAGIRGPSAPQRVEAGALSRWADEAESRLRKPRASPVTWGVAPGVEPMGGPRYPGGPQSNERSTTGTGTDPRAGNRAAPYNPPTPPSTPIR
ncbi:MULTISPECIES: FecR family protein [unclassified Caballeronia]|uniref:FecR family protein n=1 Tax=unclassified Caballeronia TaxID=2646786 RepID=UPI00285CC29F|nr:MULTISPECIES: FecR family protein [unclassified Caballeronia]MDR5753222.1 FecR family protein [Caballeronia sp. LZ024]MDR5840961.1 FecR family protein [Caballeronia sp. LZ031]